MKSISHYIKILKCKHTYHISGLPPLVLDCDKYGKISAHYYSVNSGYIEEVNGDFEFNTISEYTIIGNIYGQI